MNRTPSKDFTLQYVEVIQRHHKRTPYGSNTFFKEDVTWSCVGQGALYGLKTSNGPGSDATDIQVNLREHVPVLAELKNISVASIEQPAQPLDDHCWARVCW